MATGKLAEVEEDAQYLTEKRFADQREEYQREQDKFAREQAKANKIQSGATNSESDAKKGKE